MHLGCVVVFPIWEQRCSVKASAAILPHGRLTDYYTEYRSWRTASTPSGFTPLVEKASDDDIGDDGDVRGDGQATMFNTCAIS